LINKPSDKEKTLLEDRLKSDKVEHNAYQIRYYESQYKPNMQPAITAYILRHVNRMIEHAKLDTTHQILEVGAGLGRCSMPLLAMGFKLTCIDISQKMLGSILKHSPNLPVHTAGIDVEEAGNYFHEKFDRIIGFFTLHHLKDLEACFRGMASVAAPGAVIAFCEPVAYNPLYYLQIAFTKGMTWKGDGGIINMRAGYVLPVMRRAGLCNARCVSYGFFPPFITNTVFGSIIEDKLERIHLFRWAHAFQVFVAQMPV